ncbi:hypothetical protein R3P38DRAFT_2426630, partial [Favolaschia claudopus]
IANKRVLSKSDVVDRGVSTTPQTLARFGLGASYMFMVSRTIRQMQSLLSRTAKLVPGRSSHFVIDPYQVLLAVLTSAKDMGELITAWTALSKRMELAQSNLTKYRSEI